MVRRFKLRRVISIDYGLHIHLVYSIIKYMSTVYSTGEIGYDRLNGTRKIGPSYPKSVVYI